MLNLYRGNHADFSAMHFHAMVKTARLRAWLHGDQDASLTRCAGDASGEALSASQEVSAPADGRDDAAPGRTDACLADRDQRKVDLVMTLEDATSAILSAFPVDEEGTASSLRRLAEVIGTNGLFCSFYADRGSLYFYTFKAGESRTVRISVCGAGIMGKESPVRPDAKSLLWRPIDSNFTQLCNGNATACTQLTRRRCDDSS
jgi:hypothetical protein